MAETWDSMLAKMSATFDGANLGSNIKFVFEDGRNVHVFSHPGGTDILEDSAEPSAVEMRMTFADAILIMNRKLAPARAIMSFRLKVKGDMAVGWKVAHLFSRPLPPGLA